MEIKDYYRLFTIDSLAREVVDEYAARKRAESGLPLPDDVEVLAAQTRRAEILPATNAEVAMSLVQRGPVGELVEKAASLYTGFDPRNSDKKE